ncbi:hypothetical protein BJ970_007668, partial [Saccharopolyspora phatthalungensis]|nr:hypothetical protein [Saccharopolyspora phatthalungensis]
MSIVVPEEVRRLFQVLTGEDMTDADEDGLLRVGEVLVAGAGAVEGLRDGLREVVARVRGEFSGKAADRFAENVGGFVGVLEVSGGVLRGLGVFVRDVGWQVKYLKFVTVGGLVLLLGEIAWAVAMAGATGGASLAWLAARVAVMRFVLSRWWGQLFMRLAVCAGVGVGLNVLPDVVAQGVLVSEGKEGWSSSWTRDAAGVGAMSAGVGLPLSALGNVVGKTVARVLVAGLGDQVDRGLLVAAARRAVEEHAELYPVSGLARFADVVAEGVDEFVGMSVRGLWAARFGRGLGESLEEGLTEMVGELAYGVATGQGVQFNPFSFTAGVSESVASGAGRLAGLVLRGELIPPGTRYRDGSTSGSEKTPLLPSDSELETVDSTGFSVSGGGDGGFRAGVVGMEDGKSGVAGEKGGVLDGEGGTAEGKSGIAGEEGAVPGVEGGAAEGKDRVPGARVVSSSAGSAGVSHSGVVSADGRSGAGHVEAARHTSSVSAGPGAPDGSVGVGDGAGIPGRSGDLSASVAPATGPAPSNEKPDGPGSVGRGASGMASASGAAPTGDLTQGSLGPDSGKPSDSRDVTGARPVRGESTAADGTADGGVRWAEHGKTGITENSTDFPPTPHSGAVGTDVQVTRGEDRPGTPPPAYSPANAGQSRPGTPPPAYSPAAADIEQVGTGAPPPPAHSTERAVGQVGAKTPPVWASDADPIGYRPSDVDNTGAITDGGQRNERAEATHGASAGSAHASGPSPDPAPSATSRAPHGQMNPDGVPLVGREPSRGETSSHAVVSGADVATGPGDSPRPGDPVAGALDSLRLPPDSVRVQVPAGLVSGGAVAEFLRSRVRGSAGGPVLMASADVPGSGVVVSRGQASEVARELGRDVVALVPGRGGHRWMRFAANGSRPRPVGGLEWTEVPQRAVEGGEGPGAGLSAAVPGSAEAMLRDLPDVEAGPVADVAVPGSRVRGEVVAGWSVGDLRREIERARLVAGPRESALVLVQHTHDVTKLAGHELVSVAEVVELVAARRLEQGVVEARRFSRELAAWLGTEGGSLGVRAGAGSDSPVADGDSLPGADGVPDGLMAFDPLESGSALLEWPEIGGDVGSWSVDPLDVGQLLGSAWDEVPGGGVPAEGGSASDADVVAADGFGDDLDGLSSVGDVGVSVSVGESSGRKRGRVEDAGDEDAESERRGRAALSAKMPGRKQLANSAEVWAEMRRADEAGQPHTGQSLGEVFGGSARWGQKQLAEYQKKEGGVSRADVRQRERDAVWAEVRRAREAGEPHTGETLGKAFGKSKSWGRDRLAEFKRREGGRSAVTEGGQPTVELEDVWAEVRRAAEEGQPHNGTTLAKVFGKSGSWGRDRLAEFRRREGGKSTVELEDVWAEVRRAAEEGEPHNGTTLAEAFGMGRSWGRERLAEFKRREGRTADEELDAVWAEVRRAEVAGEPHTGATLGSKFGKSESWGVKRLAEFRVREGAESWADSAKRKREAGSAQVWAELRRARDAGEPHTAKSLAEAFGKSSSWGSRWIAKMKRTERDAGQADSQAAVDEPMDGFLAFDPLESGTALLEWTEPAGEAEPWSADPLSVGRFFDLEWDEFQGGETDRVSAGVSGADAGVVAAVWSAEASGEVPSRRDAGGSGSVGESSGRKRGRVEDGGDEDAESERHGRAAKVAKRKRTVDFADVWAELRRAGEVGERHTGATLGDKFGKSKSWGKERLAEFRRRDGEAGRAVVAGRRPGEVWAELRRADEAGRPHTGRSLAEAFGKSKSWGKKRLSEFRQHEGDVSQADVAKPKHDADLADVRAELRRAGEKGEPHTGATLAEVWAELQRADEAGKPHSGTTLATVFGRGKSWGVARLAEFRQREGGVGRAELMKRERETELEGVWAEVRRADEEGRPHTGNSLAEAFGKSGRWGNKRLAEFREREGGESRAEAAKRKHDAVLEEVGRADEEGQPHTGRSLAEVFGKSVRWGNTRLSEFREREGGESRAEAAKRKHDAALEEVWAEVRRADDAGEPHTGATLAEAFEKRTRWGYARLREFRESEGDPSAELAQRLREMGLEAVWAEVRRADAADVPHTGKSLGEAFGRGSSWGRERLAEFRRQEGATTDEQLVGGQRDVELAEVWAEVRRARDAGGPYTGPSLGKAFGKGASWGYARLAEFRRREGGDSAAVGLGAEQAMSSAGVSPGSRDVAVGIVRGTHDVVRLAGEGALDGVVERVVERVRESGPGEGVRFSRELAASMGTQGSGLAVRAGGGAGSPVGVEDSSAGIADSQVAADEPVSGLVAFDPGGSEPERALQEWAASAVGTASWLVDPSMQPSGSGHGEFPVGQGGQVRIADSLAAVDESATVDESMSGLMMFDPLESWPGHALLAWAESMGDAEPWSADPLSVGQSLSFEWGDIQGGQTGGVPAEGLSVTGGDVVEDGWFAGDSGGFSSVADVGGSSAVGESRGRKRGREAELAEVRAEIRRARDAGEPHTSGSLGKAFGKSESWGYARLGEFRAREGGASRAQLSEWEREAVWAELRRARDAGEPYTGVSLGQVFGKSASWGAKRLAELRKREGDTTQRQSSSGGRNAELEKAWAEIRRARDAGESHTGMSLGKVFGKSESWGCARLAEFRASKGEMSWAQLSVREREAVWAELRRARDAGELHTGETLAAEFGKSGSWGSMRLAEFRAREGGLSRADVVQQEREAELEAVWAEIRCARDAGVPHSGRSLGETFGKSATWGKQRLGEFREMEGRGSASESLGAGEAVSSAEAVPAAETDVVGVERLRLLSELVGLLGSLRGLLTDSPEGYRPGLRARVEDWSARLGRGELDGADVTGLRRRLAQAAELLERVRTDRLGGNVGGRAVEGESAAGVDAVTRSAGTQGAGSSLHPEAASGSPPGAEIFPASVADSQVVAESTGWLAEVWAEVRRAREVGEPHTGASLGNAFGKSASWGVKRLAEFRDREGMSGTKVVKRRRGVDLEQVWAEVRRADEAGMPHTGVSLGKAFEKSSRWGSQRLAEFRERAGGATQSDLARRKREVVWAEVRRARDAGEPHTGQSLGALFGKGRSWGVERLAEFKRSEGAGSGAAALGSGEGMSTEEVSAGVSQGEAGGASLGLRDVAVGIVRGTHDVVRLARADALDGVVERVAERVRESGRAEGVRFSRELAASMGTQGSGLAVRAGGGGDSPVGVEDSSAGIADSQVAADEPVSGLAEFDPGESEPERALLEWAASAVGTASWLVDPSMAPSGSGRGEFPAGQGDDVLGADLPMAGGDEVAAEGFAGDPGGLSFVGDLVSWSGDLLTAGESSGLGWDEVAGGDMAGASADGLPGADQAAGEWPVDDSGRLALVGDVDGSGVGERSGSKRRRVDDLGDEVAGLERPPSCRVRWTRMREAELEKVWVELRRARDAGEVHNGRSLGKAFGKSESWGLRRLREFRQQQRAARRAGVAGPSSLPGAEGSQAGVVDSRATVDESQGGLVAFDPWNSEPIRALLDWAEPVGETESWSADPLSFQQSLGFGWEEVQGVHTDDGPVGVVSVAGADPAAEDAGSESPPARHVRRADVWAELRRADEAGEPHTGRSLANAFGKKARWGCSRLSEFREQAGGVGRAVWAELRRADEAGEPHTDEALAAKFGKRATWGHERLAEFRERESVWAELRRADGSGETHTGKSLASKFGKSVSWGHQRLAEFREQAGGVGRAELMKREREAAWAELRRARDAGEPHTGVTLGKKFGKSAVWGAERLAELREQEGSVGPLELAKRDREAAWAELRRARDAGEHYSGGILGKKFGKSRAWGKQLIAQFKASEGGVSAAEVVGSGSGVSAEGASAAGVGAGEHSGVVSELSGAGSAVVEPGAGVQGETAELGVSSGSSVVAVEIVRGTHDVVRLAREDALAGVVDQVAEKVRESGRAEAVRFSRELAATLGTQGAGVSIRAGAGSDSPEDAEKPQVRLADSQAAIDESWWADPSSVGQSSGFGWDAIQGGHMGGVSAEGMSVAGGDAVGAEWFAGESGGLSSFADAGGASAVEESHGLKRGRVDDSADEDAESEKSSAPRVPRTNMTREGREAELAEAEAELRRARDAGEPHTGETLAAKFGKGKSWGKQRIGGFWEMEGGGSASERLGSAEPGSSAEAGPSGRADAVEVERLGLVSELVGLVGSLWELLVIAPEGYRPGLRARVEDWSARLGRGELAGADVAGLRRRLGQATQLLERVRTDRLGWNVGGGAVEGAAVRVAAVRVATVPVADGSVELSSVSGVGGSGVGSGRTQGRVEDSGEEGADAGRRASRTNVMKRRRGRDLEAVWAEVRRAREAGEPHTGATLGAKFGKSTSWGYGQLADFRLQSGDVSLVATARRERDDESEKVMAELRRARDAGQAYNGVTLGRAFGRSATWGKERLAEFRRRERGTTGAPDAESEQVWAELRRARDAGEPHTSRSLGALFNKGRSWGAERLAEFRRSQGDASAAEALGSGEGMSTEEVEAEPLVSELSGADTAVVESSAPGQTAEAGAPRSSRDVAVGIVQGTHDVVRLARAGSLDEVVRRVAEKVRESGREEALRFSRELAATLGSQGTGLSVRAGAGPDSPAGAENPLAGVADSHSPDESLGDLAAFAPLVSDPEGFLPEWAESTVDLGSWWVDPPSTEQSWGFGWDGVSGGRPEDVLGVDLTGADVVADEGFEGDQGGLSSVGEAGGPGEGGRSGRKRRRVDESGDEGAESAALSGGSVLPTGAKKRMWGAGLEAVWAEVRRARDAGKPHSGATLAANFGKSVSWGCARLGEFREWEGGATRADEAQREREEVWAEVRRARDAGEPHTGVTLAAKFGKSKTWGKERLAEFRRGEGGTAEFEEVWAEVRRAEEAGEPHTGASLAAKFGKSARWGGARLGEFRGREGGVSRADAEKREREAVWAEVRRARDAGGPHTGASLGAKFEKSASWGCKRLADFRLQEGDLRAVDAARRKRDDESENVMAELRRARDAGESYDGVTLGKAFGRSVTWGKEWLAEFRRRERGATRAQLRAEEREAELEQVWVEVRRAEGAGEPHTGRSLGVKFGKSASWGKQRLAQFRRGEGVGSGLEALEPGGGVPVEGEPTEDAGLAEQGVQAEPAAVLSGWRDVAVGIVRGTHDVVRLARVGSLDEVVQRVAERVRESGRAEAVRFSRELAVTLGSEGAGLAIRAGEGPESPAGAEDPLAGVADSQVPDESAGSVAEFDLLEPNPERALREWAESTVGMGSWMVDPPSVGQSLGFGWDEISGGRMDDVLDAELTGADVVAAQGFEGDPGVLSSVGEAGGSAEGGSSGRKRRRGDGSGDDDAESVALSGDRVTQAGVKRRMRGVDLEAVWVELRRAEEAGEAHTGASLGKVFGKNSSWGIERLREFREREGGMSRAELALREREEAWVEVRRARDAGEAHTGASLGKVFGKNSSWGIERLREFREREGGMSRAELALREREEAWVEVRRARDAGEAHTGASLGKVFGKNSSWGKERLREFREREGSPGRAELPGREEVWAELRRADEAGKPHSGVTLARQFGKRTAWAYPLLAEFRETEGGVNSSEFAQRKRDAALEEVWAEVRRAEEAGEPHTGPSLAAKFAKGSSWGGRRLAEFRRKARRMPPAQSAAAVREAELEKVWVEVRRARDAGEPHTGRSLGAAFGKSAPWGVQRLAQFREIEGSASGLELAQPEREVVWAELRRADETGEPHTGLTLGKKFGKSKQWGYARLAEFRRREGSTSQAQLLAAAQEAELEKVWVEVRRARDVGEPHTGLTLGKKFGKTARWGRQRLAEFRGMEGGGSALEALESAGDVPAAGESAEGASVAGSSVRGEAAEVSSGSRDVAVGIVRGTHDVVRLARVGSLDDVVWRVAERVGESGRAEAVRFSRELAATLGSQGSGFAIRAGAGPDSPGGFEDARAGIADSRDADELMGDLVASGPVDSGPGRALPEWTDPTGDVGSLTIDPSYFGLSLGFAWDGVSDGRPVDVSGADLLLAGADDLRSSRVDPLRVGESLGVGWGGVSGGPMDDVLLADPSIESADVVAVEGFADVLGGLAFGGGLDSWSVDPVGFGQSLGSVWEGVSGGRVDDVVGVELSGADVVGHEGFEGDQGGLSSVGEVAGSAAGGGSSGRKRARVDDADDEGAEFEGAAGGRAPGAGAGKRVRGVDLEAVWAELRRADEAGEPHSGASLGEKFGKSRRWGNTQLAEFRAREGGASRAKVLREREREAVWAELRRADEAGEPHSGESLGEKFWESSAWGTARLGEFREREVVWVELRRADEAGEPHTAASLGEKFGKSKSWGGRRLAEFREEGGTAQAQVVSGVRAAELEKVWVELRRAEEAGEPHTAASLGEKFGKSKSWGGRRLAEFREEGDTAQAQVVGGVRAAELEKVWVELRRAEEAGEPHTAASLGEKFGKSASWGYLRLVEFRRMEGGTAQAQVVGGVRAAELEKVWVELRRAEEAGEPHTAASLGEKFGKSASWGYLRLLEFRRVEGVGSAREVLGSGVGVLAEGGSAVDASVDVVVAGRSGVASELFSVDVGVGDSSAREEVVESGVPRSARDVAVGIVWGTNDVVRLARVGSLDDVVRRVAERVRESGRAEAVRFSRELAATSGTDLSVAGADDLGSWRVDPLSVGESFGVGWDEASGGRMDDVLLADPSIASADVFGFGDASGGLSFGGDLDSWSVDPVGFGQSLGSVWEGASGGRVDDVLGADLPGADVVAVEGFADVLGGLSSVGVVGGSAEGGASGRKRRRVGDSGDEGARSERTSGSRASGPGVGKRLRGAGLEEVWAEVRRAEEAGAPHKASTLAKKFGKRKTWGYARLAEVREQEGGVWRPGVVQREVVWAELRRAEEAGEPHTGSTLAKKFGKSSSWGYLRLGEFREQEGGVTRDQGEEVWAEVRRARDAGEPHTGVSLARKFGKGTSWGAQRLAEFGRREGATTQAQSEKIWAELRRARDAGEPHTGKSLGKAFGKGTSWGKERLAEFRRREGGSGSEVVGAKGGVPAEGESAAGAGVDVASAGRSAEASESPSVDVGVAGSSAQGQVVGQSLGWRDVAVEIVRRTHDVVRLARAGSLDEVVERVAERARELGREEGLRFSRELAAAKGTEGNGVAVRAGAGSASPQDVEDCFAGIADSQDADESLGGLAEFAPLESDPERVLLEWAQSTVGMGSWLVNPPSAGQSLGFGWDEFSGARAEDVLGAELPGADVVAAEGFAGASGGLSLVGEAGGPAEGGSGGRKRRRVDGSGVNDAESERPSGPGVHRAGVKRRIQEADLEAVWVELRRARDAGEPHTGWSLGVKFEKSVLWGKERLAEFKRREGGTSKAPLRAEARDAELEKVWVELRRAEEAGEPHTGATLGTKFGKSAPWGRQRLREFRRREGGTTQAQLVAGARDAESEKTWAEVRRAEKAGEPHTTRSLGVKFGKSAAWGWQRLAEFKRREVVGSVPDLVGSGAGVPAEGGSAVDVGVAGRSGEASELFSVNAGVGDSSAREEVVGSGVSPGSFVVAVEIVRGTHDVVRLARAGSLNEVVDQVAEKVREFGREEALRFSRELAATLGFASVADSQVADESVGGLAGFDPLASDPERALLEWAESTVGMGSWLVDPPSAEQSLGFDWDEISGGRMDDVLGADLPGADVVAAEGFAGGSGGLSLAGEVGGSAEGGRSGRKRRRDGLGDGGAESAALSGDRVPQAGVKKRMLGVDLEAVWAEARRARDAGEPYTGATLGAKFGKSASWGVKRLGESREREGATRADVVKREAVWAEVRRAEEAGEPHSGVTLARHFGKSLAWGYGLLAEF